MLKNVARHLFVVHFLVFVLVLAVLSTAVYLSVMHAVESEEHQRLQTLSDALVSSMESPGDPEPEDEAHGVWMPDGLRSHVDELKNGRVTIQWFDPHQQKLAEKGPSNVSAPLDASATFQLLKPQHTLLLTRSVERSGQRIGYLRVGLSLSDADNYLRHLVSGLILASGLSLIISCLAILWLTRMALRPVERSIQKLAQFTADASHELKSPVMVIKTNGAVALRHADGMRDVDREKFVAVLDAADQMNRTIADLLNLAESEQPLRVSELVVLNIDDLLKEVVEELRSLADEKHVAISFVTENPKLQLKAREEDIRRVLLNVIQNAIQYSKPGDAVSIRASKTGRSVRIEVKDTGIGISKADLPRIFDRFWRSDKARSHTSGGNGLGLSIVESIVGRYKGSATVKSELGEGTIVTVSFPDWQ